MSATISLEVIKPLILSVYRFDPDKDKKVKNNAKPETLCKIDEIPIMGRLFVKMFKYTGRLSFSFIRFKCQSSSDAKAA